MKFYYPYFIARRLSSQKGSGSARLIIRIAIGSVALSTAVMILAVAIVKGYQFEIRSKIIGFSTHIQISQLDMNNSFETTPVYRDTIVEKAIANLNEVKHLQPFAIKAGIIKTKDEFAGIVLKGVDTTFDWSFLQHHIISGKAQIKGRQEDGNKLLVSQKLANKLNIKVGDNVLLYLAQQPPRVRKFAISGIYNTGLGELDEVYAFTQLEIVQKLNSWNEHAISGYEVQLHTHNDIIKSAETLLSVMPYNLEVLTIKDLFPQLFDWLNLLDLNVWVIIILMIVVACINMITALLILIIERSNMIGLLKAMGARNQSISSIFINMASYLIVKGLLIGNIIGLVLAWSQYQFHWFTLSEEAYYLSSVPIQLHLADVVLINIGSAILCMLMLVLPSSFVSKIKPVRSIKFQ
jgi:lipoprotein-releasing system permease protein